MARRGGRPAIGLTAIALCASGCTMLQAQQQPPAARTLALPAEHPSVLLVITNQYSAAARQTTATLVAATARPGERLILLSDHGGQTLASSTAPPSPSLRVPAPLSPLPASATSFQKARHAQAVSQYQATLRRDQATLLTRRRAGLITWARSVMVQAEPPVTTRDRGTADIGASLKSAAAVLSSLRQLGAGSSTPVAVAIADVSPAAARSAPGPGVDLQGAAVTVGNFPGGSEKEAAWQSSLLQAGATRVTMLSQATGDEFAATVGLDLDAASLSVAVRIPFGLGQYTLSAAVEPQLRHLLRLLTTRYAQASVTINGYTDELPAPGGNLRLSRLRARSVAKWLTGHGIAPERLQDFGDGTADAVALNTASGQPLDRRVIVVINPAAN